jgi:hypothetical protein
MKELHQGYRIPATKGSAPATQCGQLRSGRRHGRVASLEIGAEGLANQFRTGARFRLADLLELPHHCRRQGDRHGLSGSHLVLLSNTCCYGSLQVQVLSREQEIKANNVTSASGRLWRGCLALARVGGMPTRTSAGDGGATQGLVGERKRQRWPAEGAACAHS